MRQDDKAKEGENQCRVSEGHRDTDREKSLPSVLFLMVVSRYVSTSLMISKFSNFQAMGSYQDVDIICFLNSSHSLSGPRTYITYLSCCLLWLELQIYELRVTCMNFLFAFPSFRRQRSLQVIMGDGVRRQHWLTRVCESSLISLSRFALISPLYNLLHTWPYVGNKNPNKIWLFFSFSFHPFTSTCQKWNDRNSIYLWFSHLILKFSIINNKAMSYSIDNKRLKQLVDYYSPHNSSEEIYCLNALKGEEGVLRYLQTSAFQGIDSTSIEDRLVWFGSNDHIEPVSVPLHKILMAPLEYLVIKFYALECVVILFMCLLTDHNQLKYPYLEALASCVGFLFTYALLLVPEICQHFENVELRKYSKPITRCQVWRDNERIQIFNTDLVVGDIVQLKEGSIIGADGIIIEGELTVEEKLGSKQFLTNKAVNKRCVSKMKKIRRSMKLLSEKRMTESKKTLQKWSPIVIGGSRVVEGQGRMTVLCVGKLSREGIFVSSIHRAANQRKSFEEQKIAGILFDISKYMIIALIIKIFLFITKLVAFIFLKYHKDTSLIPWNQQLINLGNIITIMLVGLPIYPVVGLGIGVTIIKWKMKAIDKLHLKYAKDCTKMKEVSTIGYNFTGKNLKINLLKWWNQEDQFIDNGDQEESSVAADGCQVVDEGQMELDGEQQEGKTSNYNKKYHEASKMSGESSSIGRDGVSKSAKPHFRFLQTMVKSLRAEDISPLDVGLKINTFYPFLGDRYIENINIALNNFADQKAQELGTLNQIDSVNQCESDSEDSEPRQTSRRDKGQGNVSDGELKMSYEDQNSASNIIHSTLMRMGEEDSKDVVYLKGSAETIFRQCTHIMDKRRGKVYCMSAETKKDILERIWRENSKEKNSVGLAYVEVNPQNPKVREPGYRMVFVGIVFYYETHNQKQFEALSAIRNAGTNLVLITDQETHEESVTLAKEFGIIMPNKPSIQLKGYDLKKIAGGIICRHCKKSICSCEKASNSYPRLKNQDEFNRIQKHLHVVSEASQADKLVFATGITNARLINCMVGFKIDDIPALRASHVCVGIKNHIWDKLTQAALEIIIPSDSLVNFKKLMGWGIFSTDFIKKYLTFSLTPCIVAFVVSSITVLISNQFAISILHCTWVSLVICPLLGVTFAFVSNQSADFLGQKLKSQTQKPLVNRVQGENYEEKSLLSKQNSRHISSQVILQVLILLIVLFFGQNFIPQQSDEVDQHIIGDDWAAKYKTEDKKTVCWGLKEQIFTMGDDVYQDTFQRYGIHSRHLTFVFNLFVLMQIVNFFNCRKANETSLNSFEGMGIPHIIIVVIVLSLQVLVVTKGGNIWGLYPNGLNFLQWILCVGFSLIVIIVGLLVKQLPNDETQEQNTGRKWVNRSYNLAVMSIVPRETLIDFEIEEDYEMRKLRSVSHKI